MKNRWWIILMILACLLWAVSCAQRGAAEVMQIGSPAAEEGPVTVEDEVPAAEESLSERPPHGMIPFVVRGAGEDLAALGHPPTLTVAGPAEAVRPSCTWTNDGVTMIACGMGPLNLVTADLLDV